MIKEGENKSEKHRNAQMRFANKVKNFPYNFLAIFGCSTFLFLLFRLKIVSAKRNQLDLLLRIEFAQTRSMLSCLNICMEVKTLSAAETSHSDWNRERSWIGTKEMTNIVFAINLESIKENVCLCVINAFLIHFVFIKTGLFLPCR